MPKTAGSSPVVLVLFTGREILKRSTATVCRLHAWILGIGRLWRVTHCRTGSYHLKENMLEIWEVVCSRTASMERTGGQAVADSVAGACLSMRPPNTSQECCSQQDQKLENLREHKQRGSIPPLPIFLAHTQLQAAVHGLLWCRLTAQSLYHSPSELRNELYYILYKFITV